jgi:hypothetical protein
MAVPAATDAADDLEEVMYRAAMMVWMSSCQVLFVFKAKEMDSASYLSESRKKARATYLFEGRVW